MERRPAGRPSNRPGVRALAYRVDTHGTFKQRMVDRLRGTSVPVGAGQSARPLAALTTRDPDDPAIALVDAWAMVADVITFYQERIANEGFLRTATEPRSVVELARAVGYELAPGIAASVHLAFLVEDAPGAPLRALVPKGTKVQSIPGHGELPQTFETMEALNARAEWNELGLHIPASPEPDPTTVPQKVSGRSTELWLAGTDARLKPGDVLLAALHDQASPLRRLVTLDRVDVDAPHGRTRVSWGGGALTDQEPATRPAIPASTTPPAAVEIFALRQPAGLFGNVAPNWTKLPEAQRAAFLGTPAPTPLPSEWPNFFVAGKTIDLDATYPGTRADSWAVIVSKGVNTLFRVVRASTLGLADFTLTGKVTRLELDAAIDTQAAVDRRTAAVLLQSEPLPLAATIPAPVLPPRPPEDPTTKAGTTSLTLDRLLSGLLPGRPVIVRGATMPDPPGDRVSEVVSLTGTSDRDGRTTLHVHPGLREAYRATSVRIAANVVRATHGETVADEALGSGDGRIENQRFKLRRGPVTHLSAATVTDTESTLEVRVNDVLWQQAPSLFGLTSRSQTYIVRRDHDGNSRVIFGDGTTGARLPSGQENVVSSYRSGSGLDGNVGRDTLTLLQTRPLGVRSVTNPRAAQGGAPQESAQSARERAPRTVSTLGRVVSLTDVEALAESLPGLGKARAAYLWTDDTRLVHLTVADAVGGPVAPDADLARALRDSFATLGNGLHRVHVDGYVPRAFALEATLYYDPRFRPDRVIAAVTSALEEAFSFERRAFGQGVSASEAIAIMHTASGLAAVDLDLLYDNRDTGVPSLRSFIPAQTARVSFSAAGSRIDAAELLVIDATRLRLRAVPAGESRS